MTFASIKGLLGPSAKPCLAGNAFAIAPAFGVEMPRLAPPLACIGIAAGAWARALET
jgi:hypothetical protein